MSSYENSESLRKERNLRTRNLFNRVWEDDADSDATIDLDDEEPDIRIEDGGAVMYYGSNRMYDLELVSGLRTDDRMYTCRGDIIPNDDNVKVYKEISRVLDEKLVSFPGTYGCACNYTGDVDVEIQADDVVPYYYTSSSPLRGTIDFDKMLPAGEDTQRRVMIINVTSNGTRLRDLDVIPEHTIIYLAGRHSQHEHDEFVRRFASDRDVGDAARPGSAEERAEADANLGAGSEVADPPHLSPAAPLPGAEQVLQKILTPENHPVDAQLQDHAKQSAASGNSRASAENAACRPSDGRRHGTQFVVDVCGGGGGGGGEGTQSRGCDPAEEAFTQSASCAGVVENGTEVEERGCRATLATPCEAVRDVTAYDRMRVELAEAHRAVGGQYGDID